MKVDEDVASISGKIRFTTDLNRCLTASPVELDCWVKDINDSRKNASASVKRDIEM